MKLLIDSDVLLDVGLNRSPFAPASIAIVRECERSLHAGILAWHTLANVYYMLEGARGPAAARQFVTELIRFFEVARSSTEAVRNALSLQISDFEDALQVAAGLSESCSFIITRNLADYRRSPLKAISPSEFLRRFSQT